LQRQSGSFNEHHGPFELEEQAADTPLEAKKTIYRMPGPQPMDLRSILTSVLGVIAFATMLVLVGDYNAGEDYAGPLPRAHDGNSIVLNIAANMKSTWQWVAGQPHMHGADEL